MKMARTLFKDNRVFYYITLIIWLSACICGNVCAFRLGNDGFLDISAYVKTTLETDMSVWSFIRLGILENVRFFVVLIVCSSAPILLPLIFALTGFKGFAAGFTSAIIIRIYALRGAMLCFGTVVLPYMFSMPIIFMMIVSACVFSFDRRKNATPIYRNDKSKEWFTYILIQMILLFLLCIISVAEGFWSKFALALGLLSDG